MSGMSGREEEEEEEEKEEGGNENASQQLKIDITQHEFTQFFLYMGYDIISEKMDLLQGTKEIPYKKFVQNNKEVEWAKELLGCVGKVLSVKNIHKQLMQQLANRNMNALHRVCIDIVSNSLPPHKQSPSFEKCSVTGVLYQHCVDLCKGVRNNHQHYVSASTFHSTIFPSPSPSPSPSPHSYPLPPAAAAATTTTPSSTASTAPSSRSMSPTIFDRSSSSIIMLDSMMLDSTSSELNDDGTEHSATPLFFEGEGGGGNQKQGGQVGTIIRSSGGKGRQKKEKENKVKKQQQYHHDPGTPYSYHSCYQHSSKNLTSSRGGGNCNSSGSNSAAAQQQDAAAAAAQRFISPRFKHFAQMLWTMVRIEVVIKNYTVAWFMSNIQHSAKGKQMSKNEATQLFSTASSAFYLKLYKIFMHAIQHVVLSLTHHLQTPVLPRTVPSSSSLSSSPSSSCFMAAASPSSTSTTPRPSLFLSPRAPLSACAPLSTCAPPVLLSMTPLNLNERSSSEPALQSSQSSNAESSLNPKLLQKDGQQNKDGQQKKDGQKEEEPKAKRARGTIIPSSSFSRLDQKCNYQIQEEKDPCHEKSETTSYDGSRRNGNSQASSSSSSRKSVSGTLI
jgi:hypothetical protein